MLKDKFKALIVNENQKDSKKKIENVVVFIIILIITVIAINSIWGKGKTVKKEEDTNKEITKQLANTEETVISSNEETIEKKIETILSNIEGVGKVKVLITYKESSEVVAMYNENNKNSTIEEKDSGGRNKNYHTNRYTKRHCI